MKKENYLKRLPLSGLLSVKQEIVISPVVISAPVVVSLLFICSSIATSSSGNLVIGLIILTGNLVFGIPFVKCFVRVRKKSTSRP